MLNHTFDIDMPDGSYSIAALQNYFEYIIKNMKLLLTLFQC